MKKSPKLQKYILKLQAKQSCHYRGKLTLEIAAWLDRRCKLERQQSWGVPSGSRWSVPTLHTLHPVTQAGLVAAGQRSAQRETPQWELCSYCDNSQELELPAAAGHPSVCWTVVFQLQEVPTQKGRLAAAHFDVLEVSLGWQDVARKLHVGRLCKKERCIVTLLIIT